MSIKTWWDREQATGQSTHSAMQEEIADLRTALAERDAEMMPVAEIVGDDMGSPFNAIQVRTHFFKEVPQIGTKLYAYEKTRAEPNKAFATCLLSAAAKSGDPGAISLAAQLAGVAPCEQCDYVKSHCKCAQPKADLKLFDWTPSFSKTFPDSELLQELTIHHPSGKSQTLVAQPTPELATLRTAAQQALEDLNFISDNFDCRPQTRLLGVITALTAALKGATP